MIYNGTTQLILKNIKFSFINLDQQHATVWISSLKKIQQTCSKFILYTSGEEAAHIKSQDQQS